MDVLSGPLPTILSDEQCGAQGCPQNDTSFNYSKFEAGIHEAWSLPPDMPHLRWQDEPRCRWLVMGWHWFWGINGIWPSRLSSWHWYKATRTNGKKGVLKHHSLYLCLHVSLGVIHLWDQRLWDDVYWLGCCKTLSATLIGAVGLQCYAVVHSQVIQRPWWKPYRQTRSGKCEGDHPEWIICQDRLGFLLRAMVDAVIVTNAQLLWFICNLISIEPLAPAKVRQLCPCGPFEGLILSTVREKKTLMSSKTYLVDGCPVSHSLLYQVVCLDRGYWASSDSWPNPTRSNCPGQVMQT